LKPVSLGRGKTVYDIACFEYLDTSIGPYNEVGLGVLCLYDPVINIPILPVLFPKRFTAVLYIHHLPVTTKTANDAGNEIWGYPKFQADIEFEDSQTTRNCILRVNRNKNYGLQQ